MCNAVLKFPEVISFDHLLEGRITGDAVTNRKLKRQVSLYEQIGLLRLDAWYLSQSKRYTVPVRKRKVANAYQKILIKVQEAKAFYKELEGVMNPIHVPDHLADPLPV